MMMKFDLQLFGDVALNFNSWSNDEVGADVVTLYVDNTGKAYATDTNAVITIAGGTGLVTVAGTAAAGNNLKIDPTKVISVQVSSDASNVYKFSNVDASTKITVGTSGAVISGVTAADIANATLADATAAVATLVESGALTVSKSTGLDVTLSSNTSVKYTGAGDIAAAVTTTLSDGTNDTTAAIATTGNSTAKQIVVDSTGNVTGLSVGGTVTYANVKADDGSATGSAVVFSVDNVSYKVTSAGAAVTQNSAVAGDNYLSSGTVYLGQGDSVNALGDSSTNPDTTSLIKAVSGDLVVTASTTKVTLGDLDNGDTFTATIGGETKTYSVVQGVLTCVSDSSIKDTGGFKISAAQSTTNAITADLTVTDGKIASTAVGGTTYHNGKLTQGTEFSAPDVDNLGLELKYNYTAAADGTTAVDSFANGEGYVSENYMASANSSSAIGNLSYDSANDVVLYDASGSAKKQIINATNVPKAISVEGSAYADIITGNAGKASTLSGGDGKDSITAANSNTALGGAGQDSLRSTATAAATAATLTGGADADVFDVATGAQFAVLTDFSLADGDTVSVAKAAVTKEDVAKFGVEGNAQLGTSYVTVQSSDGFYTARLKDATDTRIVAWVGENATAIDNSGTNYKNVIFKGTGNEKGDVLTGGAGNDTFLGGIGDSIVGGAGNDSISLIAKNATNEQVGRYVAISSTSGKDTVDGFTAAFDTVDGDWLGVTDGASTDIVITTLATKSAKGNVTVKSGNGSAVLNNVSASTDTGAVELNINGAKVATIAEGTVATIDSADYAQFYIGTDGASKKSGANLSNVTGDLMVDLSQTEIIRNIDTLVGGAGNTTLMGSTSADSLVAGEGRTSLWGGASGSDTLVSGADTTSFFYGTGSGKDTVVGFQTADADAADVLTFIDGGLDSISRTNTNTFEVKMGSGERLTVNQSVSGADKAVKWQLMDGSASGVAKIAVANNKLTYDSTVTNYYGSSSKDTVSVASSADNVSIWLDGSQGVSYSSIEIVDAKSSTGNATLAGGSGAETIYGGQGASSLWGGADTSNDVLVGSGKGTAMFFYGLGQGNDVINATTKNDTVNLYGVNLSDITAAAVDSTKVTVTTTANETLTVNGSVTKFTTGDGQTFYADHRNKTWSTTAV